MKHLPLVTLVIFIVIVMFGLRLYQFRDKPVYIKKPKIVTLDTFKLTQKYVYTKLVEYDVKHPKIVLRQVLQETGHFTSRVCLEDTNLFGLFNGKRYLHFSTYEEGIECYLKNIQRKYKGGDYYEFLRKLPYAQDSTYVDKLKQIKIDGNI